MKKMNRILNILLICGLGILLFLSIGVIATRAMAAEPETSPCYTVSVADADHGIIALDEDVSLIPGEQIHLQITAEEGYQLAALDVRDASDSPLDLIDQDGNKITAAEYPDQVYFKMPESNVTVMAQFVSETVNENDSEENTDDVLSMIGADIPLAVSMNGEERMMARAAASGTLNKAQNLFACYHKDGSFDCTESLLTLNNQWVWCIEPSINIGSAGGNYTLGYNGNAAQWLKDKYGWSYSKTNNLTKAVYLAKNYFGSDGYCNYVLVQDLIWSEIKESESARDAGRYVLTDGAHKTTHKCGHLDSKAKVDAAIADIWSKFFNYNKLPSFNGWTVYATAGQSYWLKDTNNVVGDTSFINPSNVEVTRGWDGSNNGIWIKSNANMAGKSININYYKNAIPNSSEPVLIYIRSGYQAVSAWNNAITPTYGSIRVVFSRTSYLKAHYKARTAVYPSMKLDINKTDTDTGEVLAGAVFDIYLDNTKITSVITDKNGKAVYQWKGDAVWSDYVEASRDVLDYKNWSAKYAEAKKEVTDALPAKAEALKTNTKHTWKVVEVKAPDKYELNEEVWEQTFDLTTKAVEISYTDEPSTGYLKLNKVSADSSLNPENGYYSLKGAVYGVYESKKDASEDKNRAATLTTDETGTSNTVELVRGTYYVKEMKASKGYKLCDGSQQDGADELGIHTVEVKAKETNTFTCKEEPWKGSITIYKKSTDGIRRPLQGVTFKMVGETDGDTYTAVTDADGKIVWDQLFAQKYVITEVQTVDGMSLLKDNLEADLPMQMTLEEIDANGADISQAVYEEATGEYCFYHLTFTIDNSANFEMPITGGHPRQMMFLFTISGGMVVAGLLLYRKKSRA